MTLTFVTSLTKNIWQTIAISTVNVTSLIFTSFLITTTSFASGKIVMIIFAFITKFAFHMRIAIAVTSNLMTIIIYTTVQVTLTCYTKKNIQSRAWDCNFNLPFGVGNPKHPSSALSHLVPVTLQLENVLHWQLPLMSHLVDKDP